MQKKTEEMIEKVKDLLIKNNYISASDLAQKCHLSVYSIYKIIRFIRLDGIGVTPTQKGYVLSEFAQKSDDVGFMRRCFGRRTSDIISLSAMEKDIRSRWSAVEEKNNLTNVFKYLSINPTNTGKAQKSIKYMLSHVNGKGN
jgi:biotin operon repressor